MSNPIQRTSLSNDDDSDNTNKSHHSSSTHINPLAIKQGPRRQNLPLPHHDKSNTDEREPISSPSSKPNIPSPLSPSFQSLRASASLASASLSLSPKQLNPSPKQIPKSFSSSCAERSSEVKIRNADTIKSKHATESQKELHHKTKGGKHSSSDGEGFEGPLASPPTSKPAEKRELPRIETEVSSTTTSASAFSEAGDESAHSLAPFVDNGTFAFMDVVGSEDSGSTHPPSHVATRNEDCCGEHRDASANGEENAGGIKAAYATGMPAFRNSSPPHIVGVADLKVMPSDEKPIDARHDEPRVRRKYADQLFSSASSCSPSLRHFVGFCPHPSDLTEINATGTPIVTAMSIVPPRNCQSTSSNSNSSSDSNSGVPRDREQRRAWFGVEHSSSQRETSKMHFAKKNSGSSNDSATVKVSTDGIESGSSASFREADAANAGACCNSSDTQSPENLQRNKYNRKTSLSTREEGGSSAESNSIGTIVAAANGSSTTPFEDRSVTRTYAVSTEAASGGPSSASAQRACTNGLFHGPSDERKREQQHDQKNLKSTVGWQRGAASFRSSYRSSVCCYGHSPGLVSLWSASPQLVSRTNANAASYVPRLPNDQSLDFGQPPDNRPNRVALAPHKKTSREKNDASSTSASPSLSSSPPVFYSVVSGSRAKVDVAARGQQHGPPIRAKSPSSSSRAPSATSASSRPASALLSAVTSQPSMVLLCGLPLILSSATANRNPTHKKNHTCTCACLISKHADPNPLEPNESHHHHHPDAGDPSPMLSNAPASFVSLPSAPPSYFFRPFGGSFDLRHRGKPTLEQQILNMAKQHKKADEKNNKYTLNDGQLFCDASEKEQGQVQSSPPVIVREVFNEGLSLNSPAQGAAPANGDGGAKGMSCVNPQNEEVKVGGGACGGMMTIGGFASFRLGVTSLHLSPSADVPRDRQKATAQESPSFPPLGDDQIDIVNKLATAGSGDVAQKKQSEAVVSEKHPPLFAFASSPSPKVAPTGCDHFPADETIVRSSLTTMTSSSKVATPRILDRRLPFLIGHDTEFRTSSTVTTDIRTESGNMLAGNDSAIPAKPIGVVAKGDFPDANDDAREKEITKSQKHLTSVGGEDRRGAYKEEGEGCCRLSPTSPTSKRAHRYPSSSSFFISAPTLSTAIPCELKREGTSEVFDDSAFHALHSPPSEACGSALAAFTPIPLDEDKEKIKPGCVRSPLDTRGVLSSPCIGVGCVLSPFCVSPRSNTD